MSGEQPTGVVRRRVVYRGRVQGVFFRATARELARGVVGFVRNEPDGSVWLESEGPPEAVERHLAQIARRYRDNVTSMETTELSPRRDETSFVIRHD